jgi:hypothetical protein
MHVFVHLAILAAAAAAAAAARVVHWLVLTHSLAPRSNGLAHERTDGTTTTTTNSYHHLLRISPPLSPATLQHSSAAQGATTAVQPKCI